jgi:putative transposase
LARSTFYYRQKALSRTDRHAALRNRIRSIFNAHKGRYGYRRVTAAIRGLGHIVNHKTVQRLMVEMGLKSPVRPKKYRCYKGDAGRVAPDLLKRQFTAQSANQKWVTDVTEFNVTGDKLYLSPVMDLYNGEIIAFETATRPIFKLVATCLPRHWTGWATPKSRSCIPITDGNTRCPHTGACFKRVTSSRACHARQLPRQRRHGKLLRHPQIRVLPSQPVRDSPEPEQWHRELHPLLQQ